MSKLMELLRGPALGVVIMIMIMAGVLLITAIAVMIAQMSRLFRFLPSTSTKLNAWMGSVTGRKNHTATPFEQSTNVQSSLYVSSLDRLRSPSEHPRRGQMVVIEPDANESIDAVWEQVRQQ
jgi:hypothetical protein